MDSGWVTTPASPYTWGPDSYKWVAKVTFTVAGPNPVVMIATDRNWVSELLIITDETGTSVSQTLGRATALLSTALQLMRCLLFIA